MRARRIHLIGMATAAVALAAATAALMWMVRDVRVERSAIDGPTIDVSDEANELAASDGGVFDAAPFMRTRWTPPHEHQVASDTPDHDVAAVARPPFVLLAITTDGDGAARAVLLDERDERLHRLPAGAVVGDWVVEDIRTPGVALRCDARAVHLLLDGSVVEVEEAGS
jgi:hypothetical protein